MRKHSWKVCLEALESCKKRTTFNRPPMIGIDAIQSCGSLLPEIAENKRSRIKTYLITRGFIVVPSIDSKRKVIRPIRGNAKS